MRGTSSFAAVSFAAVFLAAVLAGPATAGAADSYTQADLLHRLVDLDRLTRPPAGEHSGLFSSYDRRQTDVENGRYVHWAANDDRGQFLRTTSDGWNVMAEIEGPGVLTRLWVDAPAGTLRVLLDGQRVIDAPMPDLFTGALEPFGEPLSYTVGDAGVSYFPIGFARSCVVMSHGFHGEYQIDYTTFPARTSVARFTPDLDDAALDELQRVATLLKTGLTKKEIRGDGPTSLQATHKRLKAGEKLEWKIAGGGTIRSFLVSMTDRTEPRSIYALHNCVLRIAWDGRSEPDVEVPLPAFFGTGFGRNLYESLPMGTNLGTSMPGRFPTEGWFMYCYFPMPFADGARIEIANENDKGTRIGLMLFLRVDTHPPPKDALRFKVHTWIQNPCTTFEIPVLRTTGTGRLVGVTLNVDCPHRRWWGEGDHKIWIDDDRFPSYLGTSTQGLFGNVRGLKIAHRALHGVTLARPAGKNSLYRWFVPDCVDFHTGIDFMLENWQDPPANDLYYATVAYWYGQPGAPAPFVPLSRKTLAVPGLRIPGSVEIEGHIAGKDWGHLFREKYARGTELSGKLGATIRTTEPITIRLPWDKPGRYRLRLRVLPGRSFGTVQVAYADGRPIGTIRYSRRAKGLYTVGEITISDPVTPLRVKCSRTTVLDCWILEPLPAASAPASAPAGRSPSTP